MMGRHDHNLYQINSKMNEEHIRKVKEILIQWNPLREQSGNISDLNDYETEAVDIISHINTEIHFKKTNNPKKRVQIIIKEVLNEAFNLWLTDKDCEQASESIYQVLN